MNKTNKMKTKKQKTTKNDPKAFSCFESQIQCEEFFKNEKRDEDIRDMLQEMEND